MLTEKCIEKSTQKVYEFYRQQSQPLNNGSSDFIFFVRNGGASKKYDALSFFREYEIYNGVCYLFIVYANEYDVMQEIIQVFGSYAAAVARAGEIKKELNAASVVLCHYREQLCVV